MLCAIFGSPANWALGAPSEVLGTTFPADPEVVEVVGGVCEQHVLRVNVGGYGLTGGNRRSRFWVLCRICLRTDDMAGGIGSEGCEEVGVRLGEGVVCAGGAGTDDDG
jgi:hypothetical protein